MWTRGSSTEKVYYMACLRGPPENTREAVSMVSERAGGRLTEDGFEELLRVVEDELRRKTWEENVHIMSLRELSHNPDVGRVLRSTRLLMTGVGLRPLLDVLRAVAIAI